jgi:hypothetical protein
MRAARASSPTPSVREGPPRCRRPARVAGTRTAPKGSCSAPPRSGVPPRCSNGIPETAVRPARRGRSGNILRPPKGRRRPTLRWTTPGTPGGPSPRRVTGSPPPRSLRDAPRAGAQSPPPPASFPRGPGRAAETARTPRKGDPEGSPRTPADRGRGIAGRRSKRTSLPPCPRACRRTSAPIRGGRAEGKGGS